VSRVKGDRAEDLAVEFLERGGFEIVERNFFASKLGEIDIIAKSGNTLHFIEVKSGKSFEPIYNITPSKMRKIIKSIDYYLSTKEIDEIEYCLSVVIVKGDSVELLENITI
jgi:putative endonuclease